ncbi:MAG: MurR/RpiR family transcriptional regulator [Erysipelotrichaceae bacterium]|nr:MurR/RpiR family transcriptional regulator [Erysipelotrichaceae bacterium]
MDTILHQLINYMNTNNKDDIYYQLAKVMIENIDMIAQLKIESLAELCFVSPSTVSRFCRKLGYRNFNSFKEQFANNYGFEIDYTREYLTNADNLEKEYENINQAKKANLDALAANVDSTEIIKLCQLIHDSSSIHCFGNTIYQFILLYLQNRLSLFKKIIYVYIDNNKQVEVARSLGPEDVAITISPRGHTGSHYLREMYKNEVHSILITQNPNATNIEKYTDTLVLGGDFDNNLGMSSIMNFIDLVVVTYYSIYKEDLLV